MSSRTIKFRLWDKTNQQMHLVSRIAFGDDGQALTISAEVAPKPEFYRGLIHGDDCVLMQYVGLDKDGKAIYEGDIILAEDLLSDEVYSAPVEFAESGFWVRMPNGQLAMPSPERRSVIGNVYQTKL